MKLLLLQLVLISGQEKKAKRKKPLLQRPKTFRQSVKDHEFEKPMPNAGPCSWSPANGECIAKDGAPQCAIENAVELTNFDIKMDTDASLVLSYDIGNLNDSYVGFAILDTSLCEFDRWWISGESFFYDTGSSLYGSVQNEYSLLHRLPFDRQAVVNQFRVDSTAKDITLNVVNLEAFYQDEGPDTNPEVDICPGAGASPIGDFDEVTPNGTTIATTDPYAPDKRWTQHARCGPNENILFKFTRFETEQGFDFVTLVFGEENHCLSGSLNTSNIGTEWVNTNSDFLIVSFTSDSSVEASGFELLTNCVEREDKEDINDPADSDEEAPPRFNQCLANGIRVFLQPTDDTEKLTVDYTECVRRDYFNVTDFCDDDKCQLPVGAMCPGNQWQTNQQQALPRILGGEPAVPQSWPWAVSLFHPYDGHICGGSLVTDVWVITAAHCCTDGALRNAQAHIGNHYHDGGDEVAISIIKTIIHPDYSDMGIVNDLCMVQLSESAPIDNDRIQVACFSDEHVLEENATCWTAGWGVQDGEETELHSISVQVYPFETCNEMSYHRPLDSEAEFCAGNYGLTDRDSCYGDSGGPLVCQYPGSNVTTLYGVTSWGEGCGSATSVGVYAKLSTKIDWINDVINGLYDDHYGSGEDWPDWPDYPTTMTIWDHSVHTHDWHTTERSTTTSTERSTTTSPTSHYDQLPDGLQCTGNKWQNNTSTNRTRIVSGQSVTDNTKWPWLVNLSIGKRAQYNLRSEISATTHCVGTIVTDRFVLTAGRCCDGSHPSEISIYAGSNNFYEGNLYEASEIILHPDYEQSLFDNDICLIKTTKPIEFNDETAAMCITDEDVDPTDEPDCWLAGWGRDSSWSSTQTVQLQSMRASIDYCSGSESYNPEYLSLLCTPSVYYRPKSCAGDVGAPLVCRKENRLFQLGVTIRDDECSSGRPGLYTDLRRYTGWMDSVLMASMPTTATTTEHPSARPPIVQGSIDADTIGKTVGSFFEMMGSLFEYLDDE